MKYPFLFVNHGVPDVDCVDKCEEVFLWFARPVAPSEREAVMRGCPAPIAYVWHWDESFCYFGSDGDTYEATLLFGYAPPALRAEAERPPKKGDAKGWRRSFERLSATLPASLTRFAGEVERWVRGVHEVVPVVLFWGPSGAPDDDPWHVDSLARFSEVMYARLDACRPSTRAGKGYLAFIRERCDDLLIAPAAPSARDRAADARAVATLDARAARALPRRYVSRLSYDEEAVHAVGELVARHLGDGPDADARLAALAPATRLVYLASYAAESGRALDRLADPAETVRALVATLPPEAERAVVPLVVMMASNMVHDTPGFDRARRGQSRRAAALLATVLDHPRCTAGTWARASRYWRWSGALAAAAATARAGIARYGERVTLRRALDRATGGAPEAPSDPTRQ